jgi:hypothetical protein
MARKIRGTDLLVVGAIGGVAWIAWQTMFGHKRRIQDAIAATGGYPAQLDRQLTETELAMAQIALKQDMNEEWVNEGWVVVPAQDEPSLAVTYETTPFGRVLVVGPTTLARLNETGSFAAKQQNGETQFSGWMGV